ncbi:type II toxin-antitoxin system RelE/ParE family toxin [Telmatospirillum siberiense]|uniref:Type II toxin-antitoxin system RelE/ParE family toxin n=1 Tax=Telmatospirillum siberiense TaxID=382514 RepID=A0A2N3PM65_9PROT|nr:type II toxin-antitoxin system RelE/ParE family toxin [Telmatospirillum siberiense]PKU21486.1 type II toxin-antitoxin system RelE/ParE family toxin [Telmatospirillum siberiense]
MAYELTELAERDIKGILRETDRMFGDHQLIVYANIIDLGLAMVGDDPERGGSIDRPELGPGIRFFHLEHAAGRNGGAAHCLYFTTGAMRTGVTGTIILRVLWEGMEPRHKVIRSFKRHAKTIAEQLSAETSKEDEPSDSPR